MRIDEQSLAKFVVSGVVVELIDQKYPSPSEAVIEQPLHTIGLVHSPRHELSRGRFNATERRQNFEDLGRVLFVPASVPLEVLSSGGGAKTIRCMFDEAFLSRYLKDVDLTDHILLSRCLDVKSKTVSQTLYRLGQELRTPGLAMSAMVEALGITLAIEMARYFAEAPREGELHRGGLSRRHLNLITGYVEGMDHSPSLSDLSELTGLSIRHLTRAFKQTTGQTVFAYMESVRFEKAKALLLTGQHQVKEIAQRLGFSCTSSFSVAFRKLAGVSPQEYQRQQRASRILLPGQITRH